MTQLAEHVFNVMTNEGEFYRRYIKYQLNVIQTLTKTADLCQVYQYIIPDAWRTLANFFVVRCTTVRPDEFSRDLVFTVEDRDALARMLAEKYNEEVMEGTE